MDSKITIFALLSLAVVFAFAPIDYAFAQPSDAAPDGGGGEYKDGEHEGKSCPSKEKKAASKASLNL